MNPQDKNLDREGGKKCTYPRCACDSKAACTVPQAGAAVPSEQDKRLAIAAAKNESLSVHARVMAAINARQSKAARWFYSNAPEEHVRELVSWVLSITSASGAGEVKPWRERLTPEGEDEYDLADQHTAAETAMMAEIADLRAQLASERNAKEFEQRHAVESEKALAQAHAHLARLQAPVGESVDTPEFRQILGSLMMAYRDGEDVDALDAAIIAHIDAQLARQHQDSKPTDLSKRLRDASCNSGCTYANMTLFLQAADEIERLAAAQGEPVAGPDWRSFLEMWTYDGALQTFSSREKFRKEAAALLATPPAAQAVPGDEVRDEVAWLVEKKGPDGAPLYRSMSDADGIYWTPDHMEAIRFARRVDAERFCEGDPDDVRVTEHMWHAATKTEGEEQQ